MKDPIEFCFDCDAPFERVDSSVGCTVCGSVHTMAYEDATRAFKNFLDDGHWRKVERWVNEGKDESEIREKYPTPELSESAKALVRQYEEVLVDAIVRGDIK